MMGNGLLQLYSIIYVHVMQAEVPESAHYKAMGFVHHPHPGQGGDFDDEVPVALPGKKGNKGEKHA